MRKRAQNVFNFASVVIAAMVLICGSVFLFRQTDNTNIGFVNDPEIIGYWVSVDFVENIEDFPIQMRLPENELFLKTIGFREGGKLRVNNYDGNLWSKGYIINPYEQLTSKYAIKEIKGQKYMFLEWKSGDYLYGYAKPMYYVLWKKE